MKKLVIGITGRAGSGKSQFCSFLKRHGWKIIEADRIGWELLKRDDIKTGILKAFGNSVFENNEVCRAKLGSVVFTSIDKLKTLNRIVHPALLEELKKRIEQVQDGPIAVDAALIPEWGIGDWFYRVVLLKSNRWKENLRKRGIPDEIINGLEKIQEGIDNYNGENVIIIENNGTIEELKRKAEEFIKGINEVWISHLH
ncbi:dephospho-CoA kinase [bacterium]|nr:MAG: dephospho-CoA kinase [bacterium]